MIILLRYEALKAEQLEVARAKFEVEKKKKKKVKGEPDVEFDENEVVIRLNDEMLAKAYK